MEFTEVKDLNISDLSSILEQFNVSLYEMRPVLHDVFAFSPRTNIEVEVNDVDTLEFYVKNLATN